MQEHHKNAERGKLIIFSAGISHIHRVKVNKTYEKTIATWWINAGKLEKYIPGLAKT